MESDVNLLHCSYVKKENQDLRIGFVRSFYPESCVCKIKLFYVIYSTILAQKSMEFTRVNILKNQEC